MSRKLEYSGAPKTRTCFYAKNSDIDQDLADTFFGMKTTKVTKYLQKVRFRVLKLAFQTMVVKNDLSLVVSDGQFSILVQKFKVLSEIGLSGHGRQKWSIFGSFRRLVLNFGPKI